MMSGYGERAPVRLDTFTFSEEIERELAALTEDGTTSGTGVDESDHHLHAHLHATGSSHHGVPYGSRNLAYNNAISAARANPAAYAETHFSHPTATAAASSAGTYHPTSHQHVSQLRRLSVDSSRSSTPSLGSGGSTNGSTQMSYRTLGPHTPSTNSSSHPSPSSAHRHQQQISASHFSSTALSGTPAPEHDAYYDDDARYFNLGGSSFPLLPHNSLYESELQETPSKIGGIGPERPFIASGRVHAQHFTSILNQPQSGFIRENATRAVSGATAYLPSLASLWTFTTGVAPPVVISRASEDIASFAEESAVDPGPFVLPSCPGFDEKDLDMALVVSYIQKMKKAMTSYARNHPQSTLAAKTAEQHRRAKQRHDPHYLTHPEERRLSVEEEDASYATLDDAAALVTLNQQLNACYQTIPSEFFQPDYQLREQDFWSDEKELSFMAESIAASYDATTPGGSMTNPYTSFTTLSSYHASSQFQLPSLADQKAAQLRVYKASQERHARMAVLNEHTMNIQQELSGHLDLVEQNLQQQIARKSWIFFDALKNMKSIEDEITDCLKQIKEIRTFVKQLQQSLSAAGLGVLHQLRSVSNTRKLIHTLELMATVLKTSPTVQMLLSSGDFSASLQLISSTRAVITGELKGLNCLKHIEVKLNEHAKLIQQMMTLEFYGLSIRGGNFYLSDFNTNVIKQGDESILKLTGLGGGKKKQFLATSRTLTEDEEDRLVPLVSHLVELELFAPVFEKYCQQLQSILKQRLMDLVYELLNEVTKEEQVKVNGVHEVTKQPTPAPPATETKSDGSDASESDSASDADESTNEDEEDAAPSGLSEKDKNAAKSLLSDQTTTNEDVATTTSQPSPAATPDSSNQTPSTSPAISPPEPANNITPISTSPTIAPNNATTTPLTNTARPSERRQAAIAMPVNLNNAAVPSHSNTVTAVPTPTPAPTPPMTASAGPPPSTAPVSAAASISTRFSSLRHEQFLALLRPMFTSLMDLIQRASTIRQLAITCINNSTTITKRDVLIQQLNDLLSTLVEYVHTKVGKILQTRSGVHAALPLVQFREFLDSVLSFIQEGEKLSNKTFYALRGILLVQAKAFLVVFHGRCLQTLGTALENEKWVRVDVPPEYQALLDGHFITKKVEPVTPAAPTASANSTPTVDPFADSNPSVLDTTTNHSKPALPTWQSKSWNEAANEDQDANEEKKPPTTSTPVLKSTDSLTKPAGDIKRVLFVPRTNTKGVSGGFMKFPVVNSLLVLLQIIGQYVDCSSQLQAVGPDIVNRLVELLQMFNSRSCQLVLGAGAMHLSGLKSITATHLALASQSVGLLVTQVPVLRTVLTSRLPPKHHSLLTSFDRVSRDCQEHQKEIFTKLTGIMGELIRGMVEQLNGTPWTKLDQTQANAPTPVLDDMDKVDECVKTLMKQTCSLHRALSDLLLVEQRDLIFQQISKTFLTTLAEFINQLEMKNKPYVKLKVSYNINHIITRSEQNQENVDQFFS